MKKRILKGVVCVFAVAMLFSCVSVPSGTSYKGADAASGSTFVVEKGVTVTTFDGEDVGWRATYSPMGWQSTRVYVPQGLHNFVATAGLLTKDYDIAFVSGKRYVLTLNINSTGFIFEEIK